MKKINNLLIMDKNYEDFLKAYFSYIFNSNQSEIDDFFNILERPNANYIHVKKYISTDFNIISNEFITYLETNNQKIHGAVITIFTSKDIEKEYIVDYLSDQLGDYCNNNSAILWNFALQNKWPDEFAEVIILFS